MRHINQFPIFKDPEIDELKLKIVMGVTESWTIARETDRDHFDRAAVAGLEWTKYPCWLSSSKWEDGKGFKKFKFKGHSLYIHRASCEVFNGPVPVDNLVDHLCRVRGCCQNMHLEAVSHKENILRGANEAALMREGVPPPVSAKQINPRFFDVVEANEFVNEQFRRASFDRDKRRHWEEHQGEPPAAPPGFIWEKVSGYGTITHILQPVRYKRPAYEETIGDVARACDMKAITVPVHPREAVIPLPNGRQIPVQFTGELPKLQLADPVDLTATARAPQYKEYDFGVRVPVAPTGPETRPYHGDVFSWQQPGYVPENSSGAWLRRKLQTVGKWWKDVLHMR